MTDYKDRVSGWATDIDWSKAPENAKGAIVTKTCNVHHPKIVFASGHHLTGCMIRATAAEDGSPMSAPTDCWDWVDRPAPQWNGEGLPPVGTRLECQYAVEGFTTWHAGECIAVGTSPEGEVICVIKAGETIACYRAGSRMRPIKTPAQIAAEERHDAINKMVAIFPLVASEHEIAAALYDAGLRLPKGEDQ